MCVVAGHSTSTTIASPNIWIHLDIGKKDYFTSVSVLYVWFIITNEHTHTHTNKHGESILISWDDRGWPATPSSVQSSWRGWHTHHQHGAHSLPRRTANVLMRFCVEASEVASASLTCRNLISCWRRETMNCSVKLRTIQTIHSTSSF